MATAKKKRTVKKKPAAARGAAKKTPAKKTPAKKTPAKKTPAKKTPAKKTPAKKLGRSTADKLRAHGLSMFPDAHLKSPWPDHADLAVNDKTFAYLSVPGKPFSISCRLPVSSELALELPYTKPTGYGLGKWGWVTAEPGKDEVDMALLKSWLDESYRAQAKKSQVKALDAQRG